MRKALYIPDSRVRQMVEHAKHLNGFGSLRETVEEGMRRLIGENAQKQRSFQDIASSLQERTRAYLLDDEPSVHTDDHKAFFDELSGEV